MAQDVGIAPEAGDFRDESVLVAALRAGDDRAFAHLVRSYGPRMLTTARRLLQDPEAAREALQDAFLSVHRSIAGFESRSRLSTWLHRLVVNAALNKVRKAARRPEASLQEEMPKFDNLGYLIGPTTATEQSAEQLLQRASVRDLVRQSIESLPECHRTVLLLRDIEGCDTAEAARLLEISVSAAKVRLHRARTALRKRLEPVLRGELP